MTLIDLKTYLSARGRASVADMALHFGSAPEVVRDLLDQWARRHRVRPVGCATTARGCACTGCGTEVYEWMENKAGGRSAPPVPPA